MKRFGLVILIILVTALFLLPGCRGKGGHELQEVKRQQVSGVVVEAIQLSEADEVIETTGTVKAKTVSSIASRAMGTVTSVKVSEGDRVPAGQVLVTLDDSDVLQKVKAAEKAVEAAEQHKALADVTYQRYKNLHDARALTGQELDQVETQRKVADVEYERAKAMLREAQVYQGFTRIVAPVSGVVTEKKTDIGSMAVPGMPLFTIEDSSAYRIEANLDEKYADVVKKGSQAKIMIGSMNREITGTITGIVPSVDPATRTFLIKIAIKGDGIRNGSYGKVSIPVGRKERLLVSRKAVVEKGQLVGVYTVDSASVIIYRLVRTGKIYGDRVEVLSGLNPGEKIIVGGVEKAVDGGIVAEVTSDK